MSLWGGQSSNPITRSTTDGCLNSRKTNIQRHTGLQEKCRQLCTQRTQALNRTEYSKPRATTGETTLVRPQEMGVMSCQISHTISEVNRTREKRFRTAGDNTQDMLQLRLRERDAGDAYMSRHVSHIVSEELNYTRQKEFPQTVYDIRDGI
jgi:hypothetical protein